MDADFDARYAALVERRSAVIRTATTVSLIAIATIALEVFAFAGVIARMRRELDRERATTDALQTAAAVRMVAPGHIATGTVYRSATRGTRIGGDVYDVYALDGDRTLLVIGDVSGKGLAAAVDTTFVRFAVRTLAFEGHAPDEIVRRFDVLYSHAKPPPEAFVSLVVAVHDRRDASLSYVNAGHEACWVRRSAGVEMLAPTGPVVGIGGLEFSGGDDRAARGRDARARDGRLDRGAGPARHDDRDRHDRDLDSDVAGADAAGPGGRSRRPDHAGLSRGRVDDDLAILTVEPLPAAERRAGQ